MRRAWLAISVLLVGLASACSDGPTGVDCAAAAAGDRCASPGEHCTGDTQCSRTKICNEKLIWSYGCNAAAGPPCNGTCTP